MRFIGLFVMILSGLVNAQNWTSQESNDPFTDEMSFQVLTQANSTVSGSVAGFSFYCDSDSVRLWGENGERSQSMQFRTMSIEMVFEESSFAPLQTVELTLRLDKKAPLTFSVKPINSRTIQIKDDYSLFNALLETKSLALKTKSWNGEDYWVFDVTDLNKYRVKFETFCPEKNAINAKKAELNSLLVLSEKEKSNKVEKEKMNKEKAAKDAAERARQEKERLERLERERREQEAALNEIFAGIEAGAETNN